MTPEQKLSILRHLASGKATNVTATIVGLTQADVVEVAKSHGYPDKEKLAWAADVVAKKIEQDATDSIPESTVPPQRVASPAAVAASRAPAPALGSAAVPPQKPDEFRILINAAKQSDKKRIQALAGKILDDCAKLRGLLERETEQDRLKRQIAAEKERAKAEVERLEKALAAAKAALRGGRGERAAKPTDGPSAADVRKWAREQGVECPAMGRVPAEVRAAFDAAQAEDAA